MGGEVEGFMVFLLYSIGIMLRGRQMRMLCSSYVAGC